MTEQPTEQWVQKFFRAVTVAPAGGGGPASACRMLVSGKLPSTARLPAARPERRRKERRLRFLSDDWLVNAEATVPRRTRRSDRFISMGEPSTSLMLRVAVDSVEGLNLGRVCLKASLAFFAVGFGVSGGGAWLQRARGGCEEAG